MNLSTNEAFRAERTTISRQVRHVVRLVDDLLDVSRITRGKVLLKKGTIEVEKAIASAIETTSSLFEQRSQNLTISVPTTGLPVFVDPARLSQAIANLLINAAKYTEPRGSIAISAASEEQYVCIRVRDTGIGISPEALPRLFGLFVQAESSLARSEGGLGIGLTIARKLVELHDGSVSAHSGGIGHGSQFTIRLPLATVSEPTAPPSREPSPVVEATSKKAWRVLVVDDNEDITEGLSLLLQAMGCVTCVAHDGPSAIAAAQSFDGDLGLLDIGLPVMDGYELARQLRGMPATSKMRLVALTGYGQGSDKKKAIEAGFDDHISKPFEIDTIRNIVAALDRNGH
jgi:CheY-like chemotaxis protein